MAGGGGQDPGGRHVPAPAGVVGSEPGCSEPGCPERTRCEPGGPEGHRRLADGEPAEVERGGRPGRARAEPVPDEAHRTGARRTARGGEQQAPAGQHGRHGEHDPGPGAGQRGEGRRKQQGPHPEHRPQHGPGPAEPPPGSPGGPGGTGGTGSPGATGSPGRTSSGEPAQGSLGATGSPGRTSSGEPAPGSAGRPGSPGRTGGGRTVRAGRCRCHDSSWKYSGMAAGSVVPGGSRRPSRPFHAGIRPARSIGRPR